MVSWFVLSPIVYLLNILLQLGVAKTSGEKNVQLWFYLFTQFLTQLKTLIIIFSIYFRIVYSTLAQNIGSASWCHLNAL